MSESENRVPTAFAAVLLAGVQGITSLLAAPGLAQSWSSVSASGPQAVSGAAMAFQEHLGHTVLFGGSAGPWPAPFLAETWVLAGGAWTQALPATTPPARAHHGMVGARDSVWMFGGVDRNGTSLNDVWEWDGTTWTRYFHSVVPAPRHAMAMASYGGGFVMYGGQAATPIVTRFDDTWIWSGLQWVAAGTGPSARSNAAMCSWNGTHALLHGGRDATRPQIDETWLLDVNRRLWTRVVPRNPGPAREHFGLCWDELNQNAWLSGGHYAPTASGYADDLWRFDGQTWRQVATSNVPRQLAMGAYTIDTARRVLQVFGGQAQQLPPVASAELWECELTTVERFGAACARTGAAPSLLLDPSLLGRRMDTVVSGDAPYPLGLLALGFDAGAWNGNPLPLPLDLLGLVGCSLWIAPATTFVLGGSQTGVGVFIPDLPSLLGVELFLQGAVFDQAGLRGVTDAARTRIF